MRLPSFASIFNNTVDWVLGRPAWQIKLAGLVLSVLIAFDLVHRWENGLRDDGAQSVRDSLAASTVVRLHHQKAEIAAHIDAETVTLTRVLHRTDTLLRQVPETIVTHEDTVRAIEALPALRASTDSAIRACGDYQNWFNRYRTVCDSLDYARKAQIDGLRAQLAATHLSKFQTVLKWAEIAGAGYIGYRVGRR